MILFYTTYNSVIKLSAELKVISNREAIFKTITSLPTFIFCRGPLALLFYSLKLYYLVGLQWSHSPFIISSIREAITTYVGMGVLRAGGGSKLHRCQFVSQNQKCLQTISEISSCKWPAPRNRGSHIPRSGFLTTADFENSSWKRISDLERLIT